MTRLRSILFPYSRFIMTAFGIAFCIILMLFMLSIYRGVSEGSVGYIRNSHVDLWVMQRYASNMLRNNSILTTRHGYLLSQIREIKTISPVLFILAAIDLPDGPASVYLTGYNNKTGMGGPPVIVEGRSITGDNQIVLDKAFARKHNLKTGDIIHIRDDSISVVGLSSHTNMFVIQYAFINLNTAYKIIGLNNIVSCYQLRVEPGADIEGIKAKIHNSMKDVSVYDQPTFLQNNIREMRSGILTLLSVVAIIGGVVLTAILSLILYLNVLERRNEYAIMKALGAPSTFIPAFVLIQALVLTGAGLMIAAILFPLILWILRYVSPEITGEITLTHLLLVAVCAGIISIFSAIIPIRKISRIYPLEIFT